MKNVVQIVIFLFATGILACDCEYPGITDKYSHSDFVADVTVTKVYPNTETENGYRADIQINELFKGKGLESIYVYGRSDGGIGTSCDIFIPEGTRLIVYAAKNDDGNFGTGMCSGNSYFYNNNNFEHRELEILRLFKSTGHNNTSTIFFREKGNLHNELQKFKGIKLDKSYAIYELTFARDLTVKEIKQISGFNSSIDEELINVLKATKWTSHYKGVSDKVPDNTKHLIGLFYYPAEDGNLSFVSQYYH